MNTQKLLYLTISGTNDSSIHSSRLSSAQQGFWTVYCSCRWQSCNNFAEKEMFGLVCPARIREHWRWMVNNNVMLAGMNENFTVKENPPTRDFDFWRRFLNPVQTRAGCKAKRSALHHESLPISKFSGDKWTRYTERRPIQVPLYLSRRVSQTPFSPVRLAFCEVSRLILLDEDLVNMIEDLPGGRRGNVDLGSPLIHGQKGRSRESLGPRERSVANFPWTLWRIKHNQKTSGQQAFVRVL